jgi:signal transduction histidine kinase
MLQHPLRPLPSPAPAPAPAPETFAADRLHAPGKRRILLVEDHLGDAELTCERLAEAPTPVFEVLRARTLAQALGHLAHQPVDAIILDLNLPDSCGVDTVRRIRSALATTPIVVVTGVVDEALRTLVIGEGAEDVFAKEESNSRLFWRSISQIVERRREQQRQFQRVLDATPDAILVVSDEGHTLYVNQSAVELFGRSREDLLGEPLGFSVRDGMPAEIHISRPDGDRTCELRVVRMEWDDEHANLASVRDITERKRAEALQVRSIELEYENRRIHEANRLKTAFLANMSHELRTPLNAVIGFSELLYDGMVDPRSPQYKTFIGHILNSGKHLLQLINDVLDLSKIEAGKLSFSPETVDLGRLTQESLASLGALAAPRRVELRLEHDPGLNHAQLDPGRYKQILFNFLSNAIKFSPEGASVTVRTQALAGERFRVSVIDQGPGIAAAHLDRLFVEFQQLESGDAKRHPGTGLGLALTKRLVQAQGGQVGVQSTVGQGSEFWAALPLRAGAALHRENPPSEG